MNLRKAAEIALETLISLEELIPVGSKLAAIDILRKALAQQDRKCEAGPSLQDLWDCWDAVHGWQKPEQEPVAFTRNGFRLEWNPYYQTSSIPPDSPLYLHPAPIPEGWQLVPIEPTEEMIDCGAQGMASFQEESIWPDSWDATQVKGMRHDATKAYRYMLAVAPKYEEQSK